MVPESVTVTFFGIPSSSSPSSAPSISWLISMVLLAIRKSPPNPRMRSRPLTTISVLTNQLAPIVKSGSVNPIIHVIPNRKHILTIMANASPVLRALWRNSSGSLFETMEIKMMLSMPSTISRKQSVRRASQASAFRNISIRAPDYRLGIEFEFKQRSEE